MTIPHPDPTASVLIIGNEILSGQTDDANLHYLAQRLQSLGIYLQEVRVILDLEEDIVAAVNDCRKKYSYVFTTGGIGPTHDDITAAAVACAFEVPLICNKEAADRLFDHYSNRSALYSRMKMSEMPHGAELIDNPVSAAPGFRMDNVFVLAGVPRIMQAMFENLIPHLKQGRPRYTKIIFARISEGLIAQDLADIQKEHPDIEIGSYPRWIQIGDHGVRIVVKGYCENTAELVQNKVVKMFIQYGGEPELLSA